MDPIPQCTRLRWRCDKQRQSSYAMLRKLFWRHIQGVEERYIFAWQTNSSNENCASTFILKNSNCAIGTSQFRTTHWCSNRKLREYQKKVKSWPDIDSLRWFEQWRWRINIKTIVSFLNTSWRCTSALLWDIDCRLWNCFSSQTYKAAWRTKRFQ